MYELVGVVYLIDVEQVFPDLTKREENQFHQMLDDLSESLMDMESHKESEDNIGAFGTIAVTMEGNPASTRPQLEDALAKVVKRWKRRKPRYAESADQ